MKFSPSFALLALIPSTIAHFVLQYPHSLGFDDDNEAQGPCGGFAIESPLTSNANTTNVTVESFAIALQTTHPQSQWLFRASLTGQNWTNILPVVSQTSIGEFCLPNLKVPSNFTGSTGIIQVIGDAPDGYLYQCAVVNFVSGANTTVGPACTNATGLTATITTQQGFSNASATNATTSASGSSASATSSHSAAAAVVQGSGLLSLALSVLGAVFMM